MGFLDRFRSDNRAHQGHMGYGKQSSRDDVAYNPYSISRGGIVGSRYTAKQLFYVSMHSPIAYRITWKTAEDAMNAWFTIVKQNGQEHPENDEIQEKFQQRNGLAINRWNCGYGLSTGRAFIIRKNQTWYPISPMNIHMENADVYNKDGNRIPIKLLLSFQNVSKAVTPVDIIPKDYIFYRPLAYDLSSLGLSILEVTREADRYIQNMLGDTAERIRKYQGFPHIQVANANDTTLKAYQNRYGDFRKLDELWTDDRVTVNMLGLEGAALNPDVYYKPFIEQISIATGIPTSILRGMESGQLKSGQINLSSYYGVLYNTQIAYTPIIEKQVNWLVPGFMDDGKAKIKWNLDYAYSDIDKVAMNEMRATIAVTLRPHISDEAFARILAPLGITEDDIEEQEIETEDEGSRFGDNQNLDMNPISEESSRETNLKKQGQVRSKT